MIRRLGQRLGQNRAAWWQWPALIRAQLRRRQAKGHPPSRPGQLATFHHRPSLRSPCSKEPSKNHPRISPKNPAAHDVLSGCGPPHLLYLAAGGVPSPPSLVPGSSCAPNRRYARQRGTPLTSRLTPPSSALYQEGEEWPDGDPLRLMSGRIAALGCPLRVREWATMSSALCESGRGPWSAAWTRRVPSRAVEQDQT